MAGLFNTSVVEYYKGITLDAQLFKIINYIERTCVREVWLAHM